MKSNFIKLTHVNGHECWIKMGTVREIKPGGCYPGQADELTALIFDVRPIVNFNKTDEFEVITFVKEPPDHVVALANGKEVP